MVYLDLSHARNANSFQRSCEAEIGQRYGPIAESKSIVKTMSPLTQYNVFEVEFDL